MNCHACEVRWTGDDPCFVCGRPGSREALPLRLSLPATHMRANPHTLRLGDDGRVEGWEQRSPWAVYVREQLAARLPWLRLEAGAADWSLPVALACLLGVVAVVVGGLR